ncbi:hypothetical protein CFS9_25400 [Flavobacterium sp. CFS9]|uniref:Bacteriocin-type signal sequence-containing protein n=1 Tax=Flavobacterium sp. CFS9 TaxID=3143118 RepID=A0AAT9H357_9FLAO
MKKLKDLKGIVVLGKNALKAINGGLGERCVEGGPRCLPLGSTKCVNGFCAARTDM